MFTATEILLAAGLVLNVGAIVVVGVAFRRAVRRYRARPPAPADTVRASAAATAVVDLSIEVTQRIPVPLYAAVDPWEGTPPPPAWESYVTPREAAPRRLPAAEPGNGRRRIDTRRNAAPAAADPLPATELLPPVTDEPQGRWIELILTPMVK